MSVLRIQITGNMVAYLADLTGLQEDEADSVAQEFITRMVQSGGISTIDTDSITGDSTPSREDRLSLAAAIKEDLARTQNLICALAATFEDGTRGPLASALNCSTQDANTWARVFNEGYVVESEDKLTPGWWRGALDSDMVEEGRAGGMNATQMRRAAGLIKENKPPRYDGGGTVSVRDSNTLVVHLDTPVETDELEYRASVRVKEREQ